MKKILLGLILFAGYHVTAQTVQATVKAGTIPNTVIVAMKPSAPIANAKITTLYFSLGIPSTAAPKPSVEIKNNFISPISYTLEAVPGTEMINGVSHYVYNFLGDGATAAGTERDYIVGDNNVMEVAFVGGPLTDLSEVKIVNLPDGGKTFNSFWNIYNLGADITNQTAMFYGGTPTNNVAGYGGLSFTQIGGIALPVNFQAFYALKAGDDAKLNWVVSNDIKNDYFNVLRSTDGRNFTNIQKVNALANGQNENNYDATDNSISKLGSKEVFYQIEQFDKDGQKTQSAVRKLSVDGLGNGVSVFPNPARTTTKLIVDAPEAGKGSIIMRDALGRQVKSISAQFNKGINQYEINVMNLSAGDYNIQVSGAGVQETVKVSKIN